MNEKQKKLLAEMCSVRQSRITGDRADIDFTLTVDYDRVTKLAIELLADEPEPSYRISDGANKYEVLFYPSSFATVAIVRADTAEQAEAKGRALFKEHVAQEKNFPVRVTETRDSVLAREAREEAGTTK